jgi:nucleoside-diphosphate-sugar epimerase
MAKYVVTGGAGFIGSHLVEALLGRGHSVRVVDSLVTGSRANMASFVDRIEFVEGDLAEIAVARRAVDGMEFVLHQAAIPSVPRSVAEPERCHRANVDGTLNVLLASRDAGIRRLVFAGSSSVYGNSPTLPKREDMPPKPLSPYALHKLVGEQYAQLFTSLYGLETVTTRYFNVFGPRQDPSSPYSGVISLFIRALVDGRSPMIYGDGEQTRDFTYVANVVDGVLKACDAPEAAGKILNVATGGRISLNHLYRALQALTGREIAATYAPTRVGDVRDSQADITAAREVLGFTPMVTFEDGLAKTLAWSRQDAGRA